MAYLCVVSIIHVKIIMSNGVLEVSTLWSQMNYLSESTCNTMQCFEFLHERQNNGGIHVGKGFRTFLDLYN